METGGFAIQRFDDDGLCRIELSGELDLATAPDVSEELDSCSDARHVVVDTTRLQFVDSTGLGALVEGRRKLGCRFELIPGRATDRVLELAGLKDFFGLHG